MLPNSAHKRQNSITARGKLSHESKTRPLWRSRSVHAASNTIRSEKARVLDLKDTCGRFSVPRAASGDQKPQRKRVSREFRKRDGHNSPPLPHNLRSDVRGEDSEGRTVRMMHTSEPWHSYDPAEWIGRLGRISPCRCLPRERELSSIFARPRSLGEPGQLNTGSRMSSLYKFPDPLP
jgi:hypothetical protein